MPQHLLPEFPPPLFLTTRADLGDVSQGQLITTENYYEMFKCILNPKQLDGLRRERGELERSLSGSTTRA